MGMLRWRGWTDGVQKKCRIPADAPYFHSISTSISTSTSTSISMSVGCMPRRPTQLVIPARWPHHRPRASVFPSGNVPLGPVIAGQARALTVVRQDQRTVTPQQLYRLRPVLKPLLPRALAGPTASSGTTFRLPFRFLTLKPAPPFIRSDAHVKPSRFRRPATFPLPPAPPASNYHVQEITRICHAQ